MATIPFFAYRCLSGAELAAGLTANAEPVEVEALLDFCALNPYAQVVARPSSQRYYQWVREDTDARLDMPLCGRGSEEYDVSIAFVAPLPRARQWGDNDPCTPAPGWFGITCDAGGHIVRMCVRAHAFATRMRPAQLPNILQTRTCRNLHDMATAQGAPDVMLPDSFSALVSLDALNIDVPISASPNLCANSHLVTLLQASGARTTQQWSLGFSCMSLPERAAALSVTTNVAEVEVLLEICELNPRTTMADGIQTLCGDLAQPIHPTDQHRWGYGDPCTPPGWLGITCDEAREHIVELELHAHSGGRTIGLTVLPDSIDKLMWLTNANFGVIDDGVAGGPPQTAGLTPVCCPAAVGVAWNAIGGTCESDDPCPLTPGTTCPSGYFTDIARDACIVCPEGLGQYISSAVAAIAFVAVLVGVHRMSGKGSRTRGAVRSEVELHHGTGEHSTTLGLAMRPLLATHLAVDVELIRVAHGTESERRHELVLSTEGLPPATVFFLGMQDMPFIVQEIVLTKAAHAGVNVPQAAQEQLREKILEDIPSKLLHNMCEGTFLVVIDEKVYADANYHVLVEKERGLGISERNVFDLSAAAVEASRTKLIDAVQRFHTDAQRSAKARKMRKDFVAIAKVWADVISLQADTPSACGYLVQCGRLCRPRCCCRCRRICEPCCVCCRCGTFCESCCGPLPVSITVAAPTHRSPQLDAVQKVAAPHVQIVAWSWSLSWNWPPLVMWLRDWLGALIQLDLNTIVRPECSELNRGVGQSLVSFGLMAVVVVIVLVVAIWYKSAAGSSTKRSHAVSFLLTCWTLSFPVLVTVAVRWLDWTQREQSCIRSVECSDWSRTCLPQNLRYLRYEPIESAHNWAQLRTIFEGMDYWANITYLSSLLATDPVTRQWTAERVETQYRSSWYVVSDSQPAEDRFQCCEWDCESKCEEFSRGHDPGVGCRQSLEELAFDDEVTFECGLAEGVVQPGYDDYAKIDVEWTMENARTQDTTRLERYDCFQNNQFPHVTQAQTWEMVSAQCLASLWLFILALALPLYLWRVLMRARSAGNLRNPSLFGRLGSVYERCTDEAFYYELFCLEFRFVLILVGTLIQNVALAQILCAAITLGNLGVAHRLRPFVEDAMVVSLNTQAEIGLACQLLVMLLGLASTLTEANGSDTNTAVSTGIFVLIVVAMCAPLLLAAFSDKVDSRDDRSCVAGDVDVVAVEKEEVKDEAKAGLRSEQLVP